MFQEGKALRDEVYSPLLTFKEATLITGHIQQ